MTSKEQRSRIVRKLCDNPTLNEYLTSCPSCGARVLYVYVKPITECYCADCDPEVPSEESCL